MIGRSIGAFVFIRVCIWALQSVTPISAIYILLQSFFRLNAFRLPPPFEIWFAAEVAFYLGVYLPRKHHVLQKPATWPPRLTPSERRKLFTKCKSVISDPEKYVSGWCGNAPFRTIRRENLKDFLCWAFLDGNPPSTAEEEEELQQYVAETESILKMPLEPGLNKEVKPLRLQLDEVKMSHRSLMWYAMVNFVDSLASARMMYHGFTLFPTSSWFNIFPGRLHTLLSSCHSPAENLSYWYRPHTSKTKFPILFFHGIGIGVYPYMKVLSEIAAAESDVGIIFIEYMPVSMRICRDALGSAEFCRQIEQILEYHRIEKFALIGHSYGTFQSTYLLHCPNLSSRIDSVILIDPVSLLLHLPDVAYNFTSRQPSSANEHQLKYFASLDPGIAHTFYRRFFWAENILWKEDLKAVRKCGIIIGGKDLLLDSHQVWEYLTGREVRETEEEADSWESGGNWREDGTRDTRITATFFKHCDHAQVFDTRSRREHVVKLVGDLVLIADE